MMYGSIFGARCVSELEACLIARHREREEQETRRRWIDANFPGAVASFMASGLGEDEAIKALLRGDPIPR